MGVHKQNIIYVKHFSRINMKIKLKVFNIIYSKLAECGNFTAKTPGETDAETDVKVSGRVSS